MRKTSVLPWIIAGLVLLALGYVASRYLVEQERNEIRSQPAPSLPANL